MAHSEHSQSKLSKDELPSIVLDYQGKFDFVLQSMKDDVTDFFSVPYLTSIYKYYNKLLKSTDVTI